MKRSITIKLLFCLFTFNAIYTPHSHSMAIALAYPAIIAATSAAALALASLYHQALSHQERSCALECIQQRLHERGIKSSAEIPNNPTCADITLIDISRSQQESNPEHYETAISQQPSEAWEAITIPYGIKLKNHTGIYASAALGRVSPYAINAQATADRLIDNALATLINLQSNPTYQKDFLTHFNHATYLLLCINSNDLIERILARLALPTLHLDGSFGIHLEKAKHSLIGSLFTKEGRLCSAHKVSHADKILEEFIGATCSNPSRVLAHLQTDIDNIHNESCAEGFKRWGRSFFAIEQKISANPDNQRLLSVIDHYQRLQICAARSLAAQTHHHKQLLQELDSYFQHYYQNKKLNQLFESNDTLLDYLPEYDEHLKPSTMEELEQFSTIIEQRRKVVAAIAQEWHLPPTISCQKTVYHLLDVHAFENPITLIQTLFSYIGTQKPAHMQELISAFFFPTGIMKDFAQYDVTGLHEYLLPHTPTTADLDQLYVLNLFLIMANSADPDLVCNTYASISEWEQMQAPTNWCEIGRKRPMPEVGPCMPNFPDPTTIKRPCQIVPKQQLKTCGTGKLKEPTKATPCGTGKLNPSKTGSGKQCNHGGFLGKKQQKLYNFSGKNHTINAFTPKDFEGFEIDFPVKKVWEEEGKKVLATIDQIPPEEVNQEKIEEFIKAALGVSWEHIFSEKHKNRGVLELGSSQEEIIQILRMIIRQLYKANVLKTYDNHIDLSINNCNSYIKIFLHKNGLPRSINCFREYLKMVPRKMGNTLTWIK